MEELRKPGEGRGQDDGESPEQTLRTAEAARPLAQELLKVVPFGADSHAGHTNISQVEPSGATQLTLLDVTDLSHSYPEEAATLRKSRPGKRGGGAAVEPSPSKPRGSEADSVMDRLELTLSAISSFAARSQPRIQILAELATFTQFTMLVVLLKHPIESANELALELANHLVTLLITLELLGELCARGCRPAVAAAEWRLKVFVALVSWLDVAVTASTDSWLAPGQGGSGAAHPLGQLALLTEGLRLVKVFRVCTLWHSMTKILWTVQVAWREILSFYFLVFIFVFMWSLLGVQQFAGSTKVDRWGNLVPVRSDNVTGVKDASNTQDYQSPRLNFDTMPHAILSLHVCLIGDEWPTLMRNVIRAERTIASALWYFIPWIVVGQFFLMNILLVITIKHFQE